MSAARGVTNEQTDSLHFINAGISTPVFFNARWLVFHTEYNTLSYLARSSSRTCHACLGRSHLLSFFFRGNSHDHPYEPAQRCDAGSTVLLVGGGDGRAAAGAGGAAAPAAATPAGGGLAVPVVSIPLLQGS